jgi:protein tyrosine phosphatase (PTP) superfamily phosphohydrolase (DUF442 family)
VAHVRATGAAAGRAVADAAAVVLGTWRAPLAAVATHEARRATGFALGRGALLGSLVGTGVGLWGTWAGLAGAAMSGLPGVMLAGALAGAATGAALRLIHCAGHETRTLAERWKPAATRRGDAVGGAFLHGQARAQVSLSHLPGMRRFAHWIIKLNQKEPTGNTQDRCHAVDTLVFRGSQPGPEAFATLAQEGFKTIVNLRYETDYEKHTVESLGMRSVYIPEAGMDAPTLEQTLQFLQIARDPAMQPVYFHCYTGVDRTGTMAACYRITQGWSAAQGIAEAKQLGMVADLDGAKLRFVEHFADYWHSKDAHV